MMNDSAKMNMIGTPPAREHQSLEEAIRIATGVSVWEQEDAETLVLAENRLLELSRKIGRLKKLRMLNLGHNQLEGVPDALGELDGLTDFLYLHEIT